MLTIFITIFVLLFIAVSAGFYAGKMEERRRNRLKYFFGVPPNEGWYWIPTFNWHGNTLGYFNPEQTGMLPLGWYAGPVELPLRPLNMQKKRL